MRNNEEQKDASERTGAHYSSLQTVFKTLEERTRKERRRTDVMNISTTRHPPRRPEVPAGTRGQEARPSTSSAAEPCLARLLRTPGRAFLSRLSSQDAVPFLQGRNPFERNPSLNICELRKELQCIELYHEVSGTQDGKERGNPSVAKRTRQPQASS